MSQLNDDYPTVLGEDARFKGELAFEKGVRIDGSFDGKIQSKGTLHISEGAKVAANVEAANVTIEGQCKGNLVVAEKLRLLATARMEGDLKTNRLEIIDGAIFVGNVVVGQATAQPAARRPTSVSHSMPAPAASPPSAQPQREPKRLGQPPFPPGAPARPRPQETRVPTTHS